MASSSTQVAPVDDGQPSASNTSNQAATQDDSRTETRHMDPQLYKAAAEGKINDLNHILLKFCDLGDELTPMENTVLHIAAQFGKHKCVHVILEHYSGLSLMRRGNEHGDTPLHLAAREGYRKVVEALIEAAKPQPRDIESEVEFHKGMLRMKNKEGDTALHEAVRYHHPKVVKLLIEEDPEFTYGPNNKGNTPLYMAAERGFDDLVNIVLHDPGTSLDGPDHRGHKSGTSPYDPDHRGLMGRTALHAAVISKHPEMVQTILKWKEGLIKELDNNGWSPLHCAAYLGYTSIARQLLKSKSVSQVIYLPIKDDNNMTALHIAASRGNKGVAKLLASDYPDCCEQIDDNGNNAIHLFMLQKRHFLKMLCVRWFRTRGLLNGKNRMGQTPLHLLADLQMDHGTDFVMSARVDKMALNEDNLTARDIISSAKDSLGRKDSILRKLKSVKARAGPFGWHKAFKAIKGDNDMSGSKVSGGGDIISAMKKKGENHLVVVTIIATITFAAGFTLPGGYNGDDGLAILSKKTAFKIFLVADSTALLLSMSAICVYFFMALNNRKEVLHDFLNWGFNLSMYAMGAMMIAFMMGLYTVLPDSTWLVVFICAICGLFFIFLFYVLRKFYSSWKVMIKSSFWFRKFKLLVIKRQLPLIEWVPRLFN